MQNSVHPDFPTVRMNRNEHLWEYYDYIYIIHGQQSLPVIYPHLNRDQENSVEPDFNDDRIMGEDIPDVYHTHCG